MTENELSYIIRGAIYKVYNELGPGLFESVYEKAMVCQLVKDGCEVEAQVPVPVYYDGVKMEDVGFRMDIRVNKKVIIEIKSVDALNDVFFKQVYTYIKLTNTKLGILVNFNSKEIDKSIHRIVSNL